jgi:hypothetical protein
MTKQKKTAVTTMNLRPSRGQAGMQMGESEAQYMGFGESYCRGLSIWIFIHTLGFCAC